MKLKIGEFSKRNEVTIKTLRYYEEIELLMPREIDDYTGYRYYDVSQMQDMNKIKYLKNLGFRLDEIKEMLKQNWNLPSSDAIAQKLEACRNEIRALQKRETELCYVYSNITHQNTMGEFTIKSLPQIIVASYRTVVNSYQDLFYLCPNVIGKEMARLGCECPEPGYGYTIDHNKEYTESNIDIEYCEQVLEKKQDSDSITFKDIPAVAEALDNRADPYPHWFCSIAPTGQKR